MFWRGVWGYLPANIVQGVVGFLTIVLFTRLLSAEDFGLYAVAFSVLGLAHVAVFTWLEAAMARFWAGADRDGDVAHLFADLYRAAFALSALFLPLAALFVWLWPGSLEFRLAVAAGLAGVPVRCFLKLAQERMRAAGEVGPCALIDMAVSIGGLIIGVGFALSGAGAASPLLGLAIAPLLLLPVVLPREWRRARGGRLDAARLKTYARYGYPIAVSLALTLVLSSTDRILLAIFLNEAAVGAYHAAYSLANRTLDILFIWLGAAGTPALVMALEHGGRDRLRKAALEQAGVFMLIGLPAAAGLALVARPLSEFMIGESLRGGAALVTPWIALSALLYGLGAYYFGHAFTLGKRTPLLLAANAVPAVANVILNLILIPRFGLIGAAWATAASFAIGLSAMLWLGRRAMPLPVPWEAMIRCGVGVGAMALVVSRLPPIGGFAELMMDATVGAAVYGAVVLIVNAAGVRDVAACRLSALRSRSAET